MSPHVSYQSDTDSVWQVILHAHGNLAFDIGANGGLVSATLAARFGQVVAVEPAVESYERLAETAAANVTPLNVAVSAKKGTVTLRETSLTERLGELFTGESLPWGHHVGYREVDAVTLDDLSHEYGFPDFVKIDTEGHEVEIFKAAVATLMARPKFCIEIHSHHNGQVIQEQLTKASMPYDIHEHEAYGERSPHRMQHYWLTSK